jgi:hypothetical protein
MCFCSCRTFNKVKSNPVLDSSLTLKNDSTGNSLRKTNVRPQILRQATSCRCKQRGRMTNLLYCHRAFNNVKSNPVLDSSLTLKNDSTGNGFSVYSCSSVQQRFLRSTNVPVEMTPPTGGVPYGEDFVIASMYIRGSHTA